MSFKSVRLFNNIDTVNGHCEHCGEDTKQHINGSIRYLKLSDSDKAFIKDHGKTEIY